jgi:putative peptidoglycan lipid II flippase
MDENTADGGAVRSGPNAAQVELTAALIDAAAALGSVGGEEAAAESGSAPDAAPDGTHSTHKRIVTSAVIIGIGTLLGSILGFVRITILNVLFYPTASGAFLIALRPIQQVNDLLVGGSVSGALIPTFVDYSGKHRNDELRRIYSTVANIVLLLMAVAAVVVILTAPIFIPFETQKFSPADQQLTVTLVQITAFSLFGLGLYATTSALLYALKRVVFPAFATGIYHIGVVVCGVVGLFIAATALHLPLAAAFQSGDVSPTVLQARSLGAHGLAVGAAIGALGEFLILLPGLRLARVAWHPVLDLRHPAVRQILKLYLPIAAGLLISVLYQNLDVYLTGHTPGGAEANTTALQSGTVLVQFPVGLVAAALSFAVLPPLTAAASRNDLDDFKRTLRLGFRLALLLMVPAMVGLFVLREPIVTLLFGHGACQQSCNVRNALAVQNYAYELPFIALDQLLIAAFYARKNTLIPNIVGVVSILFYIVVAVPLHSTVGMPAVAFGDTAKNTSHALILFVLLTLSIGNLGMREFLGGAVRILLAAAAMALVAWGALQVLPAALPSIFDPSETRGQAFTFLVAGGLATLVYLGGVLLLRVEEVHLLGGIIRSRLGFRK